MDYFNKLLKIKLNNSLFNLKKSTVTTITNRNVYSLKGQPGLEDIKYQLHK